MSQQEFVPGPQSDGQGTENDEDEIYQPQYPYHWSGKLNKEGAPRDELPSSYVEPTMQRGYQAQDYASSAKQQNSVTGSAGQQWSGGQGRGAGQRFGPDGDAFEQGYRPYNTYNAGQGGQGGVPPWARPQSRRRGSLGWLFILIFLLFMIRPIGLLLGGLGAVVGVAFFALLLPILLVLLMMGIFGFIWRSASWSGRYRRFRRGPFWW